ncbi:hypothetical protein PGT21_027061 [Puccinia graminis f. sp. tritici]|uniref:Uncharacterized protein n=1 Tax=Puccinia graminis f. sp. tritici TaxID=56615 RepID=A0A5B0MXH1_PUCGR|nr:hypothetical protein PGT21_027061 [Puccinia graminis f. sp. tritici]
MILGNFRTTPCSFLNRESPLTPFFEILKRKNLLYFLKKLTAPAQHPIKRLLDSELFNHPSSHLSPIHNMLDQQTLTQLNITAIETIHQHQIQPWESFSLNTNNMKIKKENAKEIVTAQINQQKTNSENLLFTDGSSIPEQGTAAAALLNNSINFACKINNTEESSSFEAEVTAINIGLEMFNNNLNNLLAGNQHNIFNNQLNIFCDNQATITAISRPPKPVSLQYRFNKIFNY